MPAKILIAEDDDALRYAVQRALEDAGHEVEAYGNSLEAWDALRSGRPIDMVIVDLVFPPGQTNGLALARMAQQRRPRSALLIITAYSDAADLANKEQFAVVMKPFDVSVLVEAANATSTAPEN
jgi:two-component system, cell cycle response regulator CpdR